MSQPNDPLRERLLAMEPPDPNRAQQLRKEMQDMFATPLNARTRFWWIFGCTASVLFALWGTLILVWGDLDGYLRVVWGVYTAAQIAFIVYAVHVLRSGVFKLRHFMRFIAIVSPGGSLTCAVALIARSVQFPTPLSLVWAIFGLLCVMVALAWILHGRIVQSELTTREHLLRLELRLMEGSEKRSPD